jgi:transcriptional regulator with XRE-family HTH domain
MSLAYLFDEAPATSLLLEPRRVVSYPVSVRSFTTDISSLSAPGGSALFLGFDGCSELRQTSDAMVWQDDEFVLAKLRPYTCDFLYTFDLTPGPHVNKEAARENLLELRRLTGFTWEELASLVGVDRRTLHNWTQGGPVRSVSQERLAELLRVMLSIDRGTAEANRIALNRPDPLLGVTGLQLLTEERFADAQALIGKGDGLRPASGYAFVEPRAHLRTGALGLGYFSASSTPAAEADLPAPPQPSRSRRVPAKRG